MRKTDIPLFVDDAVQRHAPEFEQVHLLAVHARHPVIGVGQTNEGNPLVLPIPFEGLGVVRPDRNDHGIAPHKALMVLPQTRQLRAAVRSHEAAQEDKHHRPASAKIRKADKVPLYIGQFEVRSGFPGRDQFLSHDSINFLVFFQISSNISTVNFPVSVFCWLG